MNFHRHCLAAPLRPAPLQQSRAAAFANLPDVPLYFACTTKRTAFSWLFLPHQ